MENEIPFYRYLYNMEKIILTIKDNSKLHFFLELLNQFDFVEVQKKTTKTSHSLDRFAGIWTDAEANKMKEIIEEGCEQIHVDEW